MEPLYTKKAYAKPSGISAQAATGPQASASCHGRGPGQGKANISSVFYALVRVVKVLVARNYGGVGTANLKRELCNRGTHNASGKKITFLLNLFQEKCWELKFELDLNILY